MMVLETNGLTKKYNNQLVVNNLNMHVRQGEIYALLGRNGAGKTTTLKMVMGLVKQTRGEITVFGEKLTRSNTGGYRRIGALIEAPAFYENLTAVENLNLIASLRGIHNKNAVNNTLELVGLENDTNKKSGKFSLGMKQRLGIALALMHDPEFIILDEPTNSLDPAGIQQMRSLILSLSKEAGTSILISSHILSEVEQLADTIGIIHQGCLIEEVPMNEIRLRNRHFIKMVVSSTALAVPILEKQLGITDFDVESDYILKIYEIERNMEDVNRYFHDAHIGVSEISMNKGNLEEYFMKITGG
ncbi:MULTISPECIES: ATP-binding cassette domain-containing protein [Paenibacillus]|uniref:Bacitracin ABC transporter ATP-binding protein n=2 Tax=Paenibacillus TaxID=44249 RepID=A0A1G9TLH0_9BACL|nr:MULTISPECIES: ATP-binding cassette domain-containing protein [Paenibacillus]KWX71968.1 bacitracin ABC transporter ATP-binding protein [Paenibacillus jilunlii]QSF45069.1 ATP-binding cassette domain-containing protein [Paenibacillus tianjinensis]SDM47945.1 bacitracin transport system ATP-binding protein [Paenibacillus jilunlii]